MDQKLLNKGTSNTILARKQGSMKSLTVSTVIEL